MNTTCTSGQLEAQLKLFKDKGMTPERWNEVLASGLFADLCDARAVLSDRFRFRDVLGLNMIDRDIVPSGFKDAHGEYVVESHRQGGVFHCAPQNIHLHALKETLSLTGLEVLDRLDGQPLLGANELEFLLRHQFAIPEEWKGNLIVFLGSLYRYKMEWRFEDQERERRAEGRPYQGQVLVRCLFYRECESRWVSFVEKMKEPWNPSWQIAMEMTETPLLS